jgi:hypothetical protein
MRLNSLARYLVVTSLLLAVSAQQNPKDAYADGTLAISRVALPYKDPDGYGVLSAWIRTYVGRGSEPLVVQQEVGASYLTGWVQTPGDSPEPSNNVPSSCFSKRLRSEFEAAFRDYAEQNSRDWLLERSIVTKGLAYSLVPTSALLPGWGAGGQNPLGDDRIARYTVFSAVGFDSHRTRAVLFVANRYRLGGGCEYFLFRRSGSTWRAVKPPCVHDIVE